MSARSLRASWRAPQGLRGCGTRPECQAPQNPQGRDSHMGADPKPAHTHTPDTTTWELGLCPSTSLGGNDLGQRTPSPCVRSCL